jgi:Kef-type K+ transport system membrane component KefB
MVSVVEIIEITDWVGAFVVGFILARSVRRYRRSRR